MSKLFIKLFNDCQHTIIEREKQTDGQTYRHTDTQNTDGQQTIIEIIVKTIHTKVKIK